MEIKKDHYLSADGKTNIAYYIFEDKSVKPKAVLQVVHGMKEYVLSFKEFAEFFTKQGFVVIGNDALGHGESVHTKEDAGFFADKDGDKCVLKDIYSVTKIIKNKYPDLPIFMYGHSMGSFFARYYASVYPNAVNGFILCGTSGNIKGIKFGLFVMNILKKLKGNRARIPFLDTKMTESYNRYIEHPKHHFEWVSSNPNFLKESDFEAKYQISFTVGAYYDMVKTIIRINKKSWAKKLNKDTPILLVAGAQDPVGQYGHGVCDVYKMLENEKIKSIDLKLYGTARHSLALEVKSIKDRFYNDMLTWLNDKIKKLK